MQPEDMIQAKEWQQLNDAERKIVEPLAPTEGEFNVLKKMLLIVQEEEVPLISPMVHQSLQSAVKPTTKTRRMVWYAAAAASVIIFLMAVLFLWPSKKTATPIADMPFKTSPQKKDTAIQHSVPVVPTQLPPAPSNEVVKNTPVKRQVVHHPIIKDNVIAQNTVAYTSGISTRVGDNSALLPFVTEVY